VLLDCRCDPEQARRRIQARALAGGDPSEADLAVLERQLLKRQPFSGPELAAALVVETGADEAEQWSALLRCLEQRLDPERLHPEQLGSSP
jgi:predicted kinase